MTAVANWLKGGYGSAGAGLTVVITGQTEDAAGTITDGSSQTVTGSLVDIEENLDTEMNEVSPITTNVMNNVDEAVNNGYRITVLINGSGTVNPLKTLGDSFSVMKVVIVGKRPSATTTPTNARMTYYGRRQNITSTYQGRSRYLSVLTLVQVDIGSANPVYD